MKTYQVLIETNFDVQANSEEEAIEEAAKIMQMKIETSEFEDIVIVWEK